MTIHPEATYLTKYLAKSETPPSPAESLLERDRLISPPELAAFLSIPAKTLRQWRYRGVGPVALRIGKHVRYQPAEVRRWLDGCRTDRSA